MLLPCFLLFVFVFFWLVTPLLAALRSCSATVSPSPSCGYGYAAACWLVSVFCLLSCVLASTLLLPLLPPASCASQAPCATPAAAALLLLTLYVICFKMAEISLSLSALDEDEDEDDGTSPRSRKKDKKDPSQIHTTVGWFRDFLMEQGVQITDGEFTGFVTQCGMLFLIATALKKDPGATAIQRQKCVKNLYEKLKFPPPMLKNPNYEVEPNMLLYLKVTPIDAVFTMYHSKCFPANNQVKFDAETTLLV